MNRKVLISALVIMLLISLAPKTSIKTHAQEDVKLSNQSADYEYFEEIPTGGFEQDMQVFEETHEQIQQYYIQKLSLTSKEKASEEVSTNWQETTNSNEETFEEVTLEEETDLKVEETSSSNEETFNVSEEPVEEAEESDVFYTSPDGIQYKVVETLEFTATAYCHCQKCCDKAPDHPQYGVTASGVDLLSMLEQGITPRVIAADTSVLPFGTPIYIEVPESQRDRYIQEDYGFATVEDRGGAIKNRKIDVYYPTDGEALEWGRRTVLVHILAPVS